LRRRGAARGDGGAGGLVDYPRFVATREPIWERFEDDLAAGSGSRHLDHGALEALAMSYRQVLHDHALAAARFPETHAARRLRRLALAGNRFLYRERSEHKGLLHFFFRTFPRTFRRQLPVLALAAALFLVLAVFGLAVAIYRPGLGVAMVGPEAVEGLRSGHLWTERLTTTVPPGVSTSGIATNNLSVALMAWAGGALAGLLSLWVLVLNGMMLGAVLGLTLHYSMPGALLEFISAHGPLELTVIVVSAGGGLVLARGLVAADDRPRAEAVRQDATDALVILGGSLPWLVLLALVEVFISPAPDLPVQLKVGIGLALEVLFLSLALNPLAGPPSTLEEPHG
ncbi:MAG: stage II sporulation protein M, partial [Acidobacteria bacterium]|nr:stage II sporulation protein M [Acidobacteriota bacterium]